MVQEKTRDSSGGIGYKPANIRLRPPRVAVIIEGGPHWRNWASLALQEISRCWGGKHFILVPHDSGEVDDRLLRAVASYDPDYVAIYCQSLLERETVMPGSVSVNMDGRRVHLADQSDLLSQVGEHRIADDNSRRARETVLSACSSYRRTVDVDEPRIDDRPIWLPDEGNSGPLLSLQSLTGKQLGACLAADPSWISNIGLALGSRCGVAKHGVDTAESALTDAVPQTIRWLLAVEPSLQWISPPNVLIRQDAGAQLGYVAEGLTTAFDNTGHLTTELTWKPTFPEQLLVTVGDLAVDFALALAWDRIHGFGRWIPREWLQEHEKIVSQSILQILADMRRLRGGGQLLLAGHRSHHSELDVLRDSIIGQYVTREALSRFGDPLLEAEQSAIREKATAGIESRIVVCDDPEFKSGGRIVGALIAEPEHLVSFPVQRTVGGGFVLAVRPDAILPSDNDLARTFPSAWQVDVDFLDGEAPTGRQLPMNALIAEKESMWTTWLRASRHGITYEAGRYDLATLSPLASARLARPLIRQLSLIEWVAARGRQVGFSLQLSSAGRRAEVLSSMLGGREELCAVFGGPLRSSLRDFIATNRSSRLAYPEGDGWVLDGSEGFLTFARLVETAGKAESEIRSEVDTLTRCDVLRMGLMLDCEACGRVAFYSINDLSQHYACRRCAARNTVSARRWRPRGLEPVWFYDLHPVARDLLRQNGDVPLLLSNYLRSSASSISDIAEFEFLDSEGESVSETDLVAHVDGLVLVAEAKSNGTLGTAKPARDAAQKRIDMARFLEADEIVLASTEKWNEASIGHFCDGMRKGSWLGMKPPRLRIIDFLGTDSVIDDVVMDLATKVRGKY